MRFTICLMMSIFLLPIPAFSQSTSPTPQTVQQGMLWLQGFSTLKKDNRSRWSFPLEIQIRRAEMGGTWQQLMPRGLALYKINDRVSAGGGLAFINTWRYGKQPFAAEFPEYRIFEQLSINHKSWDEQQRFDHRVRLEQRFVRRINAATGQLLDEYNYTNRIRYLGGITVPLNEGGDTWRQKKGDWILYANDEIFFSFGKNVANNTFDQNRAAVGVGYYSSANTNFRVGYLHQYLQKGNGVQFESNHVLTLTLTRNFTFGDR
jgi:hypothetical protein